MRAGRFARTLALLAGVMSIVAGIARRPEEIPLWIIACAVWTIVAELEERKR